MKSVMQEASSVAKAIEQAWTKAGKPKDFSIKVLEEAQKNFFGMTVRSAKIALFFDEKPAPRAHAPQQRHQQPQREHHRPQETNRPSREQQPQQRQPREMQQKHEMPEGGAAPQQRQHHEPQWNDAMVAHAQAWLTETLKNMHKDNITFTIQPQHYHLRITLSSQILPDIDKEKQLLASMSALIIETLKRRFRVGLRGHKVVLTHA